MALPTQEIERITRGTVVEQGIYRQLLLLSGALFAISVILYFGLSFGYEPYLQSQKDKLDAQIADFSKTISADEQTKLITFYSQLVNLQTLLGKHAAPSQILTWLEASTQVNTYFTKFAFNSQTYQLVLSGVSTKSPDDVAEQVSIFEKSPQVQRVSFGNTSPAATVGWQFNITVFLNPKYFMAGGALSGGTAPSLLTIPQATSSLPAAGTSTNSTAPTSSVPSANSTTTKR